MRKVGYRYVAIAVITAVLGSAPFVGAAASQKEVPKRTTVKATFVKPNERKAPTVPKRVIQKPTVKASNAEKQVVSESNKILTNKQEYLMLYKRSRKVLVESL